MHQTNPGASAYVKQIDLNLASTPVTNPFDERALFYFFRQPLDLSTRQTVKNMATGRVLVSYDAVYRHGIGSDGVPPQVHAVVDPGDEVTLKMGAHHVIVWLDPTVPPASGVPAIVRVSAS